MPSESKAQQRAMGMAEAIKKGDIPKSEAKGPVKEIVDSMTKEQVHDFASTKTKDLPEHKKEASLRAYLAGYMHKQAKISPEVSDAIARMTL